MSASAPAGTVKRKIGKVAAMRTDETAIGWASNPIISHAEPVSNIAAPTFETTLAVHIAVNAARLKAPHLDGGRSEDVAVEPRSMLKPISADERLKGPSGCPCEPPCVKSVEHAKCSLRADGVKRVLRLFAG